MQPYLKKPLSAENLVDVLQRRGLIIDNTQRAQHYLKHIGYYRLSAYFIPFYCTKDNFKENTTFDQILDLYIFDRKLRLLALDPVQRIEIAVRVIISDEMALKYGSFWMLDKNLFENTTQYNSFVKLAKKRTTPNKTIPNKTISPACEHYFKKYGDHQLPPSWVLFEELSMGNLSQLFSNLKIKQDKRKIAACFQFKPNDFTSWLHSITVIRNILVHHSRFWNRTPKFIPSNIKRYAPNAGNISGTYLYFIIITTLLKTFTNKTDWVTRLLNHITTCPLDIYTHMKFPKHWETLPFWLN